MFTIRKRLAVTAIALVHLAISAPVQAERVFTLSSDGTLRLLQQVGCSGSECRWVDIDRNRHTIELAATTEQVFQLHTTGAIWRWEGLPCADGACPSWKRIDNNPQTVAIAADFDTLFQLHRNGSIWRWRGGDCTDSDCTSWTRIDNNPATRAIVAAGDKLFQLHTNGAIWAWKGGDCRGDRCVSWEMLDQNPQAVEIDFAARGNLFQRHRDGAIWRWDGRPCDARSCTSWSRIDRNSATVDICAAPGNLFQRHRGGAVWRWQGRACDGSNCSYWTQVGAMPDLVAIAAGAQPSPSEWSSDTTGPAPVYGLRAGGHVVKWPGRPCSAGRCETWIDMGDAFSSYRSDRSKLFVFSGPTPSPENRLVVIPARPGDIDGDGLPDAWERANAELEVVVGRADLILVPVVRPEVMEDRRLQQTLLDNLARVKDFYRNLPIRTERGAQGIHIHLADGNRLDDSYREDADPVIDYRDTRNAGLPSNLIGYAHGMLFGTGTGGGGQTSGPDWTAVGMDWRAVVHELGHQLGLGHSPPANDGQSPLYRSLMNYDYNYGIGGDGNDIRFSDGRFASIHIDERNLNEVLPFTAEELSFLEAAPYEFDVERIDNGSASVDWNRNNVHRERGISANIDDGYAHGVGAWNHVGHTHGDVAIAAVGERYVVFRTLLPGAESSNYAGAGASVSTPARLAFTTLRDRDILSQGTIIRSPLVTGNPSAIGLGVRVVAVAPSVLGTVQIGVFSIGADGALSGRFMSEALGGGTREVVLVNSGRDNRAELILWDPATGRVAAREVNVGTSITLGAERSVIESDGAPLVSAAPPGATYNTRTGKIVLLTAEASGTATDRLKLRPLALSSEHFVAEPGRWLADAGARSSDHPAIVFDGNARAGGEGRYLVYYRTLDDESVDGRHRMHFVRVTMPRTTGDGAEDPYIHRKRMFINEWVRTRNAPAVSLYKDDFVIAWRTPENGWDVPHRNETEVNLFASGEFTSGPADYDDLAWIARQGLLTIVPLRR